MVNTPLKVPGTRRMPVTPIDHLEAALEAVSREDARALAPVVRRRLYAKLGSVQSLFDDPAQAPKVGVLGKLRHGECSQ